MRPALEPTGRCTKPKHVADEAADDSSRVRPYDPTVFGRLRGTLHSVLSTAAIEHVGSTSEPGSAVGERLMRFCFQSRPITPPWSRLRSEGKTQPWTYLSASQMAHLVELA